MAALVKRPDGQVGGQRRAECAGESTGNTPRICTGIRTCWELDTVDPLPPYPALFLLLLLLPPSPAAFPPAAALARLLAGSRRRREPLGCAPPARPRLPPGTAAAPARAGAEPRPVGREGSGYEAGSPQSGLLWLR